MNPITPKDLAVTNATMQKLYEKAARFDEADRLVNEHAESWRQIQEVLPEPDPADPPAPLARRVVARLKLVDELQKELKVQAIHVKCAREVLQDIRRILPPCDEEAHVNFTTGLEYRLAALPARIRKLVQENNTLFKCLQGTRDHHAAEVAENGKLRDRIDLLECENEKLARLVPSAPFGAETVPAARLGNPPVEGTVFGTPSGVSALDDIRTVDVIGQAWCRCDGEVAPAGIALRYAGGWIVLCNVVRNVETGGLTYEPLARKDLPDFRA